MRLVISNKKWNFLLTFCGWKTSHAPTKILKLWKFCEKLNEIKNTKRKGAKIKDKNNKSVHYCSKFTPIPNLSLFIQENAIKL